MEVDTPALSYAGNPDPAIESFSVDHGGQALYLHTSPEFPMKRLLAAGSGDIYQICKVFRQGESGHNHNPEFTLLEWYRVGIDHHRLMGEVAELIQTLASENGISLEPKKLSYGKLFSEVLGVDIYSADVAELQGVAVEQGIDLAGFLSKDEWLDLLISHCIMPRLPEHQLTLLYDYPASQASLAKINADGLTAARFEVFWGSLELANGFHELQDATEQKRRFVAENAFREQAGLRQIPVDHCLISALDSGLPDCAGVAMGLDRLLMKLLGLESISEVLSFPVDIA